MNIWLVYNYHHVYQIVTNMDMIQHHWGCNTDLHHGLGAADLQHLALTLCAVRQVQVDDLGKLGEFDIVQNDQRAVDTSDGLVAQTWLSYVVALHGGDVLHVAHTCHCCTRPLISY